MKNEIEKTLLEIPYNSFGKILLSSGINYPQPYGGNCVFQCRRLTQELTSSALDISKVSYATAKEKPHWVTIVNDGDEYMIDPFLLCPEPINITKVLRGETQLLDTYPIGTNKIEAKLVEGKTMQINFFTRKGLGFKQVLQYTYNLSQERSRDLPPDNYQLLANLCQKNLEMGILMDNEKGGEVVRIYRQPGQGNMDIRIIGGDHYSEKKDAGAFNEQLDRVATRLDSTPAEFRHLWNKGETLYLEQQVRISKLRDEQEATDIPS